MPVPWTPATQLTCAALGPIDQTAMTFSLDLSGRKSPNAVVAADTGPFARTSSTSAAITPAGDPARFVSIATGVAQYRLALTPAAGDGARLQVVALNDGVPGDLVMQGFCGMRTGKPLAPRRLAALDPTDKTPANPAWLLQPLPQRLPDRPCLLVGDDRRLRTLSYTVARSVANELTVAYRADAPDLLGAAAVSASGTQFHLVSPARRMVSVTVTVEGASPPVFVHTAFERSGTWIDVIRDKRVVAAGACGTALPMLVGPPIGAVSQ